MGYFSRLAQELTYENTDRSCTPPETQLLWRLDDLNNKREKLIKADAPNRGCALLTDNDIRYAIPDFFGNIEDVERAIELAVEDLKNKYEIDLSKLDCEREEAFDVGTEQMTLFEIIEFPSQPTPLKVA